MTDKDKKQDGGSGQIILESRTQTKKPSMYKVVMMNDDYTPMEFVVHVLQHFFRWKDCDLILFHLINVCLKKIFQLRMFAKIESVEVVPLLWKVVVVCILHSSHLFGREYGCRTSYVTVSC